MLKFALFVLTFGVLAIEAHIVAAQSLAADSPSELVSVFAASRCSDACPEIDGSTPPSSVRLAVEPATSKDEEWLQQQFVVLAFQVQSVYFGSLTRITVEARSSQVLPSLLIKKTDADVGLLCVGHSRPDKSVSEFVVGYGRQFDRSEVRFNLAVKWCASQFAKWLLQVEPEAEFLTPHWPLSDDETRLYFKALSAFSRSAGRTIEDFKAAVAAVH